jgi:hypothetical protein
MSFMIASPEGVSRKADTICVDNLVPVAFLVDSAIHVPHRLTTHLLYHRVSKAAGLPSRLQQRLAWQNFRRAAAKHLKFKGFLRTK